MTQPAWPELALNAWADTYHTLHMWLQIVGKIRLALTPKENHWWNAALYLTSRGLTTSPLPYPGGAFEIHLDFIDHQLNLRTSSGGAGVVKLAPKTVAAFYRELMEALAAQGITVGINLKPQEVADPIPFDQDETHGSYDPEYANRCWRILLSTKLVLDQFRSRFLGKVSPVHFFWGSFDLACTRFSGRTAPPRNGVITGEAYSHECSSAGWWPGGGLIEEPAFYSYASPEPPGFPGYAIGPKAALYHSQLHEFILKYDDVRCAPSPAADLLTFFQTAYEAAATLGGWDRADLERDSHETM